MKKEFTIDGFFSKEKAELLKNKLSGKTFYNWEIGYSNYGGNCTLIVSSDYDEDIEELKKSFVWFALSELT